MLPLPSALDDVLFDSEETGKRAKFDALQQRTEDMPSLHIPLKFIPGISESSAPYSKSHSRRLKRKAKEQLAGNDMSELLNTLQPEIEQEDATPADKLRQKRASEKIRTIGKGKKSTLSETQRRKELYVIKLCFTPDSHVLTGKEKEKEFRWFCQTQSSPKTHSQLSALMRGTPSCSILKTSNGHLVRVVCIS